MKGWLREWLRADSVMKPFPREYSLKRTIIYDETPIKENGVDVYMAIFSNWQLRMDWYDVVLFDIDGDEAYWKYREVVRILEMNDITPSVVYFSGRGFHIYLWFDGMIFNDYGQAVRRFVNALGLNEFLDSHVVGDRRRMARVPHTYNIKSGLWVMKVKPTWTWAEIKGRSKMHDEWKEPWEKNNEVGKMLKELDFENEHIDWEVEGINNGHSIVDEALAGGKMFPPCIERWMNELIQTGELDHIQRFNLGLYLLHVWGYDMTYNFFRKYAKDFKPKYTEYQLKYMYRRKLKMYRCSRIEEFGLCPMSGKDCPFRPTLNAWVKWR